ncbi:protein chibby homolog 1 isoform X3 [Enhydra lutris kenyoni]|uniref:Protein chibby homolog 1 isoform X3 n=1 Tax=Enhydra lutris kenyoni TaxID=391180 RepID=A0A2Y9L0A0_ENHLU|nr:protein chibby homolog 1 isoform X3 [Enhydra lutris kenyoni]
MLDRSTREVELGLDYGTPTMNLAGQSLKFENGQWIAEMGISGGVDRREAQRLRRRNQQLEEENNLLRLKVDILLDMAPEEEWPRTKLITQGKRLEQRSAPKCSPSCPHPPAASCPLLQRVKFLSLS